LAAAEVPGAFILGVVVKKVGFFGGSFDPIHFGHISLALHLMEAHGLDEVLFCPAFCSPFKIAAPPVESGLHRLEMLRLGLELPQFKITDWEIEQGEVSYTIDTIRALESEGVHLKLLLSDESASHLAQWKEGKELLRRAPLLKAPRHLSISSSMVRERLKKKLYCGHLVPAKTLDYIRLNELYSR